MKNACPLKSKREQNIRTLLILEEWQFLDRYNHPFFDTDKWYSRHSKFSILFYSNDVHKLTAALSLFLDEPGQMVLSLSNFSMYLIPM